MLTGKAKIGYMLAYSGVIMLIGPLVTLLSNDIDGWSAALMVIGIIILVGGFVLLWRDRAARSLGWKLLWKPVMPTDWDRGGQTLIVVGSLGVTMQVAIVKWNPISDSWSWYVAIPLVALVFGWALALSEFLPSRSPHK
jgi:hypothetical protein